MLEQNHPAHNEPTLGVVVENSLYYVANSQWGSFEKGAPKQIDQLSTPTILNLPLGP
ncbi:MAG: hypothetical protein IPK82_31735 [Polyangiaceae bacterium]|nr:hypothetical protein [Polyangiaceae bacterium]